MVVDISPGLGIVFVALAVIFAGVALRDYLIEEGKLTPARNTWLRISFVFCAVAIALFVWNVLLG